MDYIGNWLMSCLEVNTSGQFPICKFFTFSLFHF